MYKAAFNVLVTCFWGMKNGARAVVDGWPKRMRERVDSSVCGDS